MAKKTGKKPAARTAKTAKAAKKTTRSPAEQDPVPRLASAVVKAYAKKQRISIKLTQEQVDAILEQWDDKDPTMPAEITFKVGSKPLLNLKVAAYRYRGDTCCV